MTVVVVNEAIESRQGEARDDGFLTRRKMFIVQVDDIDTTENEILAHSSIPQRLDPWYDPETGLEDLTLFVNYAEVRQDENPYIWHVTVNYSNRFYTDRLRLDMHVETYMEALEYDHTGNPIVNSAGELFIPGREIEKGILVFTLTRVETAFNPLVIWDYLYTLNQVPFFAHGNRFLERTCLITDIRANDRRQNAMDHEVTYTIKTKLWNLAAANTTIADRTAAITGVAANLATALRNAVENTSPWDYVVMDAGFAYRDSITDKLVPIISQNGERPTSPQKLNGAGLVLAASAAPFWLRFKLYRQTDWSPLNLNT